MIVLLTGASGFIGRHLADALRAAGHRVIEGRRRVSDRERQIEVDFTRDWRCEDWVPKLQGVDCVVNAVGILRERGKQTFERIHTRGPQALFDACAQIGIRRVIQISALGANTGTSAYFRTKHAADEHLATLPLAWTIVQPSVVYGPGGTSARLFSLLASLPIVPLPGRGDQLIQPVHIDDVSESIVRLLERSEFERRQVALVGPYALPLRDFLRRLRGAMGMHAPPFIPIPMGLMRLSAQIAQFSPSSLLDRETLAMLEAGNTASPDTAQHLLERPPRQVESFVDPRFRAPTTMQARLSWLMPVLRFSIAAVWIWTGIVSLGLYPVEHSYALLAAVGLGPALAPLLLYGAAALNIALGIATLALSRRRLLWLLQLAVILLYTIIISFKLPEFWLHPYGPLSKNLPMLVAIYMLYVLEERDGRVDG